MIENELNKFREIVERLVKAEKEEPVVEPILPEALFEKLDLSLEQDPIEDEQFYQALEGLVMNTPRTATKLFFNQLFGGRKDKAILGDLLAVMLNNSMYTYKVAGPMVGVEKEILRKLKKLLNYPDSAAGTIAPGGSMSNFMGMVMARDAFKNSIRFSGVKQKMLLYTSEDCHYSIAKNAALMGVGRDQLRYIKTNRKGAMIVEELENQIQHDVREGLHPFMVNLTAGTTVLGAFDPIEEVASLCDKHKLWLHVDGAYCGSVIFSNKYKALVRGVEKADSFCFNAHKMLGTPLSCSIFISKDKKQLNDSFSNDANYLYQTDGDDYNLGKTSIQCGRRNDALKFWALWKSIGTKGLEQMVDHQFYLAEVARSYIKSNPDYTLYSFEDSISVCFNYKGIPAEKLCTALYKNASLMVGYGTFKEDEFVRFVTINADNDKEDILNFFEVLEQFVSEHEAELIPKKIQNV